MKFNLFHRSHAVLFATQFALLACSDKDRSSGDRCADQDEERCRALGCRVSAGKTIDDAGRVIERFAGCALPDQQCTGALACARSGDGDVYVLQAGGACIPIGWIEVPGANCAEILNGDAGTPDGSADGGN